MLIDIAMIFGGVALIFVLAFFLTCWSEPRCTPRELWDILFGKEM